MKVILLGQAPFPSSTTPFCTFPQLRTWSMFRWLSTLEESNDLQIELLLLHDGSHPDGFNVHQLEDMKQLNEHLHDADAIITIGPFLPLFALLHIPDSIPVWLDYPSDPLADRHSKHILSSLPQQEYQLISELTRHALHRADAMGVISRRQSFATLGQRLLIDCAEIPVEYIPIAYDFPHVQSSSHTTERNGVVISGSNNSWLDLDRLEHLLVNQQVHCTGMTVQHLIDRTLPPSWNSHGWLPETELQKLLQTCAFGVWTDTKGIEPLLGSRTRALFYIWCGLTPIGDATTELATELLNAKCMNSWNQEIPFKPIDIIHAQQFCTDMYAPVKAYEPIKQWLQSPTLRHRLPSSSVYDANIRLREELQMIYNTKTWRWGSKFHGWIKQLASTLRQ